MAIDLNFDEQQLAVQDTARELQRQIGATQALLAELRLGLEPAPRLATPATGTAQRLAQTAR